MTSPDYRQITEDLNAGRVTLAMLEVTLPDYHAREYGSLKGDILLSLFVIMTRLSNAGLREFSFDWYRENIEPPTHVGGDGDGNWDLMYKYSEDYIGLVEIRDGRFVGYGTFCCCEDPEAFWDYYKEWSNQIEWSVELDGMADARARAESESTT